MTYGIELFKADGASLFSSAHSVAQVKAIYTLQTAGTHTTTTDITLDPSDILLVGYAGYDTTCGVAGNTVGGVRYIWIGAPYPVKVLVLKPASAIQMGSQTHGLNVWGESGELVFSSTLGVFQIDQVVTQTVYGNFSTTRPSVSNSFSTPNDGRTFISTSVPYYVTGEWEDGNNCGIGIRISSTAIGFGGEQGNENPYTVNDGANIGTVFSVIVGRYYAP